MQGGDHAFASQYFLAAFEDHAGCSAALDLELSDRRFGAHLTAMVFQTGTQGIGESAGTADRDAYPIAMHQRQDDVEAETGTLSNGFIIASEA